MMKKLIASLIKKLENIINQKLYAQKDKETHKTINEKIPKEVISNIFIQLDWTSLSLLRQVCKLWNPIVDQLCQNYILTYFSYLKNHMLFKKKPFKLFVKECKYYQNEFRFAKMSLLFDVLSGNKDIITTLPFQGDRKRLYSLLVANNHSLPEDLTLNEADKKEIMIGAFKYYASNGQLDAVKDYVLNLSATEHTGDVKGEALIHAATQGQMEIISYLLTLEISSSCKGVALKKAIAANQKQAVKRLLDLNDISSDDKGQGMVWAAAAKGNLKMVKQLSLTTSQHYKNHAFWEAAKNGHLTVVNYLLNDRIPVWYIDWALKEAAKNGHLEVVKYLWPHIKTPFALAVNECKIVVLLEATKLNHVEMIKFVVMQNEIPLLYRKIAFQEALNLGYLKIAAILKKNLNTIDNNNTQLTRPKRKMLQNFWGALSYYPINAAFFLGFLSFTSFILFTSLSNALILSTLMVVPAFVALKIRNQYIHQPNPEKINELYNIRKKEGEKHISFLKECYGAKSWTALKNTLNNLKHPIRYNEMNANLNDAKDSKIVISALSF